MSTSEELVDKLSPLGLLWVDAENEWLGRARPKQILPIDGWSLAIAKAGRGWGKSETGSQWIRREAQMYPGIVIHAIAPSHADMVGTMISGISGILAVTPTELIESTNFSAAIPTIKFKNGSLIRGFSSQSPDRLRGPQAHRVLGDEIASWENAAAMLVNIDMSTRLAYTMPDGTQGQPKRFYTTTPKPLKWLADLIKKADIVIEGSTYENAANLAKDFLSGLVMYEGTQIGKQEIHGELIDIGEAAIIKRQWLRLWSSDHPLPWLEYVFVSLDTAFTERTYNKKSYEADPTACTVWGVFAHERKWNLMLLECWAAHLSFPQLLARVRKEMRAVYSRRTEQLFKSMYGAALHLEQEKKPDILLIEDKGSGISLRQMLAQEGQYSEPFNPGRADKLSRLHAVSHVPASGRIWIPESTVNRGVPRNWTEPLLDEVCAYSGPGTTPHDDFVDSCSQAWRLFADKFLNVGVDGTLKPNTHEVGGQLAEEWIAADGDRMASEPRHDDHLAENPYGD